MSNKKAQDHKGATPSEMEAEARVKPPGTEGAEVRTDPVRKVEKHDDHDKETGTAPIDEKGKPILNPGDEPKQAQAVAVVKVQKGDLVGQAAMMSAFAGSGFEDVKGSDFAMPFYKLLHEMTDETKKDSAVYVKGALPGMWFDTITKKLYKSLIVAPCKFVTHNIEWWPRNSSLGKGMVANHGTDDSLFQHARRDSETKRDMLEKGSYIVSTGTWFVRVLRGEEYKGVEIVDGDAVPQFEWKDVNRPGVLTLSNTQQKASKKWISDAGSLELIDPKTEEPFTPPLFAMTYLIGAEPTKNDAGTWYLATVNRAGWLLDMEGGQHKLQKCIEFTKLANEQHVKIAQASIHADDEDEGGGGGGRSNGGGRNKAERYEKGSKGRGGRDDDYVPPGDLDPDIPF